jgi:ribonuclease III
MGHTFRRPELLVQALTHRSHSSHHYERLEFLGDSVLNLAVSHQLYDRLVQAPEGDLSRTRANLVKQETLHALALKLDLPDALRMGEGEAKSGGRQRPSILADALEAVIGALYLDAGFAFTLNWVQRLFEHVPLQQAKGAMAKDAKTELQEWLQGRRLALPVYQVAKVLGAAHMQTFEVTCQVAAFSRSTSGQGSSRKIAEQAAADTMLQQLKTLAHK